MNFDYEYYYRVCFVIPIFVAIFFSCLVILFIMPNIKSLISNKFNWKSAVTDISFCIAFLFLLRINIGILSFGGIYLPKEKKEDAIILQGEISEIKELSRYEFPNPTKYHELRGVQFTVNGVECAAPIKGSLEVGDTVEVVYLPKSGYVLSIQEIEPSTEP